MAHKLRTGGIEPAEIDVLEIVRAYLRYFEEIARSDLDVATETLPHLARLVELKTRLLLPKPPKEEAEEALEETLHAVTLLEDLEEAILFLRNRRNERRTVLPARTPRPSYPRKERSLKVGVGRLAQMASRHRVGAYFELAVERFTIAAAIRILREALARVRRGVLSDLLPTRDWPTLIIGFAGMLELIKEGRVRAEQPEPYAPITLEAVETSYAEEAVLEVA